MTAEERALLAAVAAAPDDDLRWLVYADWLDERVHPGGPFVRFLVRLAIGPFNPPGLTHYQSTLSRYSAAVRDEWLTDVMGVWSNRRLVGYVTAVFAVYGGYSVVVCVSPVSGCLSMADKLTLPIANGAVVESRLLTLQTRGEATDVLLSDGNLSPVRVILDGRDVRYDQILIGTRVEAAPR